MVGVNSVMILYVLIILTIYLIWHKVSAKLFADNLSPFYILYFSWILPLLLRTLQLSSLESDWGIDSIGIISWVTICLIITSLIPCLTLSKVSAIKFQKDFTNTTRLVTDARFKFIIICLFVLSFSGYLFSEFITNPAGIPLLTAIFGRMPPGGDWHRWGKETKWSLITPLLFILTPTLYLIYKSSVQKSKRRLYLFLALLFPVMGIFKLSRSDILIGGLNIAFVEYHWRKARSLNKRSSRILNHKTLLLLLFILSLAYGILYARSGMSKLGNIYSRLIGFKLDGDGVFIDSFAQVYGYLALPFENFHKFFETYNGGFNLGISSFRPLLSMLGQGYIADEMLSKVNYVPISGAAGSATFLTFIYAELGIYGLLIIPLLYGLLINILYMRFRNKPSFVNMFCYMNFMYPWFWLFFNNAFSVLTFYINFSFIFVIIITYTMMSGLIGCNINKQQIHSGFPHTENGE